MTDDDFRAVSSLLVNLKGGKLDEEFEFLIRVIKGGVLGRESDFLMSALVELADRQWDTYEILPDGIRRELGELIVKIWDKNSLDSTEKLLGVIAKLGLGNALSHLALVAKEISNLDVRQEIASAVIEFGESVNDPYSGMK